MPLNQGVSRQHPFSIDKCGILWHSQLLKAGAHPCRWMQTAASNICDLPTAVQALLLLVVHCALQFELMGIKSCRQLKQVCPYHAACLVGTEELFSCAESVTASFFCFQAASLSKRARFLSSAPTSPELQIGTGYLRVQKHAQNTTFPYVWGRLSACRVATFLRFLPWWSSW